MTKHDIERILALAEDADNGGDAVKAVALSVALDTHDIVALCRIALIAIAAREATRKEVEHDV